VKFCCARPATVIVPSMRSIAFVAAVIGPAVALANGRPPLTNGIHFQPGDNQSLYAATTFGFLVSHDDGCSFRWICEQNIGYGGTFDPKYRITAGPKCSGSSSSPVRSNAPPAHRSTTSAAQPGHRCNYSSARPGRPRATGSLCPTIHRPCRRRPVGVAMRATHPPVPSARWAYWPRCAVPRCYGGGGASSASSPSRQLG
jgi:hypothetical protein